MSSTDEDSWNFFQLWRWRLERLTTAVTTVPLRRRVTEPPVVSCTRPITCWLADNLGKLFLAIRFRCRRPEGLLGGHTPSIIRRIIQSRQGNRVIHTTARAQERNALHILTQNYRFQFKWNCAYFVDNHGRDTESRQSLKITVITAIVNSRLTYIHSQGPTRLSTSGSLMNDCYSLYCCCCCCGCCWHWHYSRGVDVE